MPRLFVLDPVCAMEYGHSLNALKYFTDMAAPFFSASHMIASRHLPGDTATDSIDRFFEFHYDYALRIERRWAERPLIAAAEQHVGKRSVAAADFLRLLKKYDMTQEDTLLFPSIDYFSAIGILAALKEQPAKARPKLLIRLIGVMETATQDMTAPQALANVISELKLYHSIGGVMTLCAETPKYAQRLTAMMDLPVLTVPYFSPEIVPVDMPQDGPITFLAGGSARPDKGFFRLQSIIDQVHEMIDPRKVHFIIQGLPDHMYQDNLAYLRSLQALPNTEVLPGQIPYAAIRKTFAESHVGLMPYDATIYEWRGSAMLMESMLFERLVICQSNTGFADQARLYQAGEICSTDAEFALAICQYAGMTPERLKDYASLARKYYIRDVDQACRRWITGEAA